MSPVTDVYILPPKGSCNLMLPRCQNRCPEKKSRIANSSMHLEKVPSSHKTSLQVASSVETCPKVANLVHVFFSPSKMGLKVNAESLVPKVASLA